MKKQKAKKVVKKTTTINAKELKAKSKALEKKAMAEFNKMKKQMDDASKKMKDFVKKNPEKVAVISAGVGAALGSLATLIVKHKKK